MYFIGDLTTFSFDKKQINVKQYIRKGKLVRQSKRNINKKTEDAKKKSNGALKVAIWAASILGIGVGSYLLLKNRYLNNLKKAAQELKANPNIGKVLQDKDNIVFTYGGFSSKANDVNEASFLNAYMKRTGDKGIVKRTEFIDGVHNWSVGKPQSYFEGRGKELRFLWSVPQPSLKAIFSGRNDEAIKQANEVWSWVQKNPKAKIKLVGVSAGGQIVQDVSYILKQRGVDVSTVTLGNFDNKMHNATTSLNIVNSNDKLVKSLMPRNPTYIKTQNQKDLGTNHYLYSLAFKPKDPTKPISKENGEINKEMFNLINKHLGLSK